MKTTALALGLISVCSYAHARPPLNQVTPPPVSIPAPTKPAFPALDGTPLTVTWDGEGHISGASGVSKQGFSRSMTLEQQPGRRVLHFTQVGLAPLELSLHVEGSWYEFAALAGDTQYSHRVDCTGADYKPRCIATTVVWRNGIEVQRDVGLIDRQSASVNLDRTFRTAFSAEYRYLVDYFGPILRQGADEYAAEAQTLLAAAGADPNARIGILTADRRIGSITKAIIWGLSGVALVAITGGGGIVFAGAFLAGFDASLADSVVSDLTAGPNQTGGDGNTPASSQSSGGSDQHTLDKTEPTQCKTGCGETKKK